MSCGDHRLFGLSFSAILVVVFFIAIPQAFLVPDQFHLGLLIQVPCHGISVGIIARVAFSRSIAGVVVVRIKPSLLLLSSVPEFVKISVV